MPAGASLMAASSWWVARSIVSAEIWYSRCKRWVHRPAQSDVPAPALRTFCSLSSVLGMEDSSLEMAGPRLVYVLSLLRSVSKSFALLKMFMAPLVFIHGMFMNASSWNAWMPLFSAKGFQCSAPDWPFHEGAPATLRTNASPGLGTLTLDDVVTHIAGHLKRSSEKPVLVGHSMGGLVVQRLVQMDLASAGVCIDSAAPAGISVPSWSFVKSNLPVVNPFKGNAPCLLTQSQFHYAFCNTLTRAESDAAYEKWVVPESRNVARTSTGAAGKIDFSKAHVPLLFLAGSADHIIPAKLNLKNFNAYPDSTGKKTFHEFEGRSHSLCFAPGFDEVAQYVAGWIQTTLSA
jgi:pimeloyl-ACP methyl ester carboxylesterase